MNKTKAPAAGTGENETAERDGPVGTLARGLKVLDALAGVPQPLGLAEVAALTGLEQSTTLRLLRALEESGFVLRGPVTKKYVLSPKALRPLPLLHPLEQLRREIAGPLRELALRIDKTVLLALYMGHERMVIDIAQGNNTINAYYGTWLTGPLHGTAAGKACLATLDAKSRAALLGPGPLARFTEATLVDVGALEDDLSAAAARGFVLAREESRPGIAAIAANVKSWKGDAVGCICATGHARDFGDAVVAGLGQEVRRTAELIPLQAPALLAAAQFCGH